MVYRRYRRPYDKLFLVVIFFLDVTRRIRLSVVFVRVFVNEPGFFKFPFRVVVQTISSVHRTFHNVRHGKFLSLEFRRNNGIRSPRNGHSQLLQFGKHDRCVRFVRSERSLRFNDFVVNENVRLRSVGKGGLLFSVHKHRSEFVPVAARQFDVPVVKFASGRHLRRNSHLFVQLVRAAPLSADDRKSVRLSVNEFVFVFFPCFRFRKIDFVPRFQFAVFRHVFVVKVHPDALSVRDHGRFQRVISVFEIRLYFRPVFRLARRQDDRHERLLFVFGDEKVVPTVEFHPAERYAQFIRHERSVQRPTFENVSFFIRHGQFVPVSRVQPSVRLHRVRTVNDYVNFVRIGQNAPFRFQFHLSRGRIDRLDHRVFSHFIRRFAIVRKRHAVAHPTNELVAFGKLRFQSNGLPRYVRPHRTRFSVLNFQCSVRCGGIFFFSGLFLRFVRHVVLPFGAREKQR